MAKSKDNNAKQSELIQQVKPVAQFELQNKNELQPIPTTPKDNMQKKFMSKQGLIVLSVVGGILIFVIGMVIGIVIGGAFSNDNHGKMNNGCNYRYQSSPMMRGYDDWCNGSTYYNMREPSNTDAINPSDTTKLEQDN